MPKRSSVGKYDYLVRLRVCDDLIERRHKAVRLIYHRFLDHGVGGRTFGDETVVKIGVGVRLRGDLLIVLPHRWSLFLVLLLSPCTVGAVIRGVEALVSLT